METTIKSKKETTSTHNQSLKKETYSLFWGNVEFNRFGIISMLILFIGCIGGFAASFGANGDILKLAMIAFPTIIALALILAVAPMKLIVYVCSIAIILDIIVLIF
jgi:hypothetical protein